jgi:phycobilisome rod-core linker protein
MSLPLLKVTPTTQNQRVDGYDVADEDDPMIYRFNNVISDNEISDVIWAAYRQIFSEHLVLDSYRQIFLESQLRNRAISLREFIRGLGKSEVYRQLVADTNSNYRLVDLSFKRFLGRASYGQEEQIAWSIVIATKGLHGFIDTLVDGQEYRENFGEDTVPYQRRRRGDRPFNLVNPRYADYWRNQQMILEGRSYYQVKIYGQGASNPKIRQGIPSNFLAMAKGIIPNQPNYQPFGARAASQASSQPLLDMTNDNSDTPKLRTTQVSLPYSYIPQIQKV